MSSKNNKAWYGRLSILAVVLCLAAPAGAQTLYVTDELQLGVHDTPDQSNPAFRNLRSGDRVQVLEDRGSYTQIRTADGAVGWVKSLYLVAEEPAKTRVDDLGRENDKLEADLETLRSRLSDREQRLQTLEQQQAAVVADSSENQSELELLRSENEALNIRVSTAGIRVELNWVLVWVLLATSAGFAVGWWWIDRRSRSRHGGFRIY